MQTTTKCELTGLTTTSETRVAYACACGVSGASTRAYAGEDVAAKAKRTWRAHANRVTRRAAK